MKQESFVAVFLFSDKNGEIFPKQNENFTFGC
jgi:hypothetical protein